MIATSLDSATPSVTALDPRGLAVRQIDYLRSRANAQPIPRITRQKYDWQGRLSACTDPRLEAANLSQSFSLSAATLFTHSVDAGWRLTLCCETAAPLYVWDGRGHLRQQTHDALGRLTAVTETALDQAPTVVERLGYGVPGVETARHNQCGRLIRHDDPAGSVEIADYGLLGAPVTQSRRFCSSLALANWPEDEALREPLLEQQHATTRWQLSALGETLRQVDARQNTQRNVYDLAGNLQRAYLHIDGSVEKPVVLSIHYDANNRIERETAGNNVISRADYAPCNGRLLQLHCAANGQPALQSLRYSYDPVGNVVEVNDEAAAPVFFRNQRVEHHNAYGYDSLYQLLWSTGFEAFDNPVPPLSLATACTDPGQVVNYREDYCYDSGGNLNKLVHVGGNQYTRNQMTSFRSNQSLEFYDFDIPSESDLMAVYDPNGNRRVLLRGQVLEWDGRNQLRRVTPVSRADSEDDSEVYSYDSQGARVRKTTHSLSKAAMVVREVRYLPGIEWHTESNRGKAYQVIRVQAGLSGVSVMHWETVPPLGMAPEHWSFTLHDHLGSGTVEVSQAGEVLSQQCYLPYGGMAWSVNNGSSEASYKTLRYSGKERDASGLIYYGLRYYAPWLQRWISPDPAGDIDGLNLYRFVRNNPITLVDADGLAPVTLLYGFEHVRTRVLRGLAAASPQQSFVRIDEINDALQINMDNASSDFKDFNEMIREGIEVESDNVDYFMQATPSYKGTPTEAKTLLQGWSDYLKAHANAFDITRKIQSYENTSTKDVSQFWKKNLRQPLSEQEVQGATSLLESGPDALFSQRTASSIVAGDAVINWQFRQFSKLALDWMAGNNKVGDESGVVFMDVIARSPLFEFKEFEHSVYTAKPYKEPGAVHGQSYNPITHSERRHLERNARSPDSSYARRIRMIGLDQARQLANG